jgi:hypothetical protein
MTYLNLLALFIFGLLVFALSRSGKQQRIEDRIKKEEFNARAQKHRNITKIFVILQMTNNDPDNIVKCCQEIFSKAFIPQRITIGAVCPKNELVSTQRSLSHYLGGTLFQNVKLIELPTEFEGLGSSIARNMIITKLFTDNDSYMLLLRDPVTMLQNFDEILLQELSLAHTCGFHLITAFHNGGFPTYNAQYKNIVPRPYKIPPTLSRTSVISVTADCLMMSPKIANITRIDQHNIPFLSKNNDDLIISSIIFSTGCKFTSVPICIVQSNNPPLQKPPKDTNLKKFSTVLMKYCLNGGPSGHEPPNSTFVEHVQPHNYFGKFLRLGLHGKAIGYIILGLTHPDPTEQEICAKYGSIKNFANIKAKLCHI